MIKTKTRDLPVITIHISQSDKDSLTAKAEERGMQLTTYCRMKLLEDLKETK